MSFFASLIIILLAMLIQGFLELSPGLFACFYHYALGKTSFKKADDRSLSFILGVEIFTATVFLITYLAVSFFAIKKDFMNTTFLWIMAGIFLVEAIISFFFYFRRGKKASKNSTELFVTRHVAKALVRHAETAKNRSDTILLGFITCALELFFTLPLYIICSVEILNISATSSFVFIIAYIIIATVPLFAIRTFFRTGHNLAEIQRFRVKKKLPTRLIISLSFLAISIVTFITGLPQ